MSLCCCIQVSVFTITLNQRMFDLWEKFHRQFYQLYFIPHSEEALNRSSLIYSLRISQDLHLPAFTFYEVRWLE